MSLTKLRTLCAVTVLLHATIPIGANNDVPINDGDHVIRIIGSAPPRASSGLDFESRDVLPASIWLDREFWLALNFNYYGGGHQDLEDRCLKVLSREQVFNLNVYVQTEPTDPDHGGTIAASLRSAITADLVRSRIRQWTGLPWGGAFSRGASARTLRPDYLNVRVGAKDEVAPHAAAHAATSVRTLPNGCLEPVHHELVWHPENADESSTIPIFDHEIGHALGFSHTGRGHSSMHGAGYVTPTDEQHAQLAYRVGPAVRFPGLTGLLDAQQPTDRAVLERFHNATDGSNWTAATNWSSASPLDDWYGVNTNDDTFHGVRVSGLDLSNNNLGGAIPRGLAALSSLERLSLADNRLSDLIPADLGLITGLKGLWLYGNALTGAIPRELGNLSSLERLDLGNNRLTGGIPAALGSMSNLKSLSLYGNQLMGTIPPELGELSNLEWLDLSGNQQLTGEVPRSFMQLNLTNLYINNTDVCAPADAEFQAWLDNLDVFWGDTCASAASAVASPVAVVAVPSLAALLLAMVLFGVGARNRRTVT
ncbi:MAG: leucine-rich repeat domain-containing protein [Acidobacteria bacterium]|nr:leucine-rich repeat domain-containing protein [Acidobacteriota bacterium]